MKCSFPRKKLQFVPEIRHDVIENWSLQFWYPRQSANTILNMFFSASNLAYLYAILILKTNWRCHLVCNGGRNEPRKKGWNGFYFSLEFLDTTSYIWYKLQRYSKWMLFYWKIHNKPPTLYVPITNQSRLVPTS